MLADVINLVLWLRYWE